MDTKQICKECGAPVAADSPQGLCPNCLMKVAMGSEAGIPGAGSGERKPAPPPGEIAKHFPQFEILALLGQGGMGAVYKARQPSLDRLVALKILPAHSAADAGFAERFNREARALAKLSHPNIVAVYEFGQTDGLHYLVMEFVDGLNLRQLQQTGKLPPREALEIIPQICEALQFAHDEGVVHRDIKPENVLLDKKGRVKIADFGLARILGVEPESWRLTGAKDFMGTPHYMAPEQIEHPQEVDHRADIYSLGVVFYEMLTGELPLGKFAPPSKKVQVDVRLDEVVLHALEKEPKHRYQHVSEVKSDVETIVHTQGAELPSSASARATSESARVEAARRQVKGPAIGLIITGILNWIGIPSVVMAMAYWMAGRGAASSILLWLPVMALVFSSLMIVAGLKMKRLETYGLAITGSVLAMLVTPGNLIGLPIGIWSLVVLSHREVRKAFGKSHPLPLPGTSSSQVASSSGGGAWKVAVVIVTAVMLLLAIPVGAVLLAIAFPAFSKARNQARLERQESSTLSNVLAGPISTGDGLSSPEVTESPQLRAAKAQLRELRARYTDQHPLVREELKRITVLEQQSDQTHPEVTESPQLRAAKAQLRELRARRYTDQHPLVREVLKRITVLEQQSDQTHHSSAFGPVIERVLYSVTAQRPIRLLDLDSGELIQLPADREKGTEEQYFSWIAERGVDLMAQGHQTSWTLTTSLKLTALGETLWSGATPATLREALTTGTNGLRREDTVFGYDQYLLETNSALPLSFAFETRQGGLGLLQITGFTNNPPGVKIRYKLAPPSGAGGGRRGTPSE